MNESQTCIGCGAIRPGPQGKPFGDGPHQANGSKTAEIDFVIRSLDEGIKTLRGIQGKAHRPLSLTVEARRQEASKLLKSMNGTAWIVARNIPLMAHNRGDNDRQREYLSFTPAVRKNPESFLELCPSEDFREFEEALRGAINSGPRPRGYGEMRRRAGAQPESEQAALDERFSFTQDGTGA